MVRRIRPSDDDGSVADLWDGDIGALSFARGVCSPIFGRSLAKGGVLSNGVSLLHILIMT